MGGSLCESPQEEPGIGGRNAHWVCYPTALAVIADDPNGAQVPVCEYSAGTGGDLIGDVLRKGGDPV
jgi:hypothetical protein